MESYEIDAIKIEKQKAMRRYQTFRKIATIVRTLEFFIAIMLVSWLITSVSKYIPATVEFSGAYLKRFYCLLFCPHFVFILGNVIVITLFAKSGDRTSFSENISGDVVSGELQVEQRESEAEDCAVDDFTEIEKVVVIPAKERETERKISYDRSRSSLEMVIVEKTENKKELRRSETEPPRREIGNGNSTAVKTRMIEVEELSNDDFRRKVEAFIEKQQRLLREESKSVVVFNNQRCNSL